MTDCKENETTQYNRRYMENGYVHVLGTGISDINEMNTKTTTLTLCPESFVHSPYNKFADCVLFIFTDHPIQFF